MAKPRSSEHRNRVLKIVAVCFAAVLVACAAVAAFWAWDTWLRFDDSADIQGEWLTANGTALVVIDAEENPYARFGRFQIHPGYEEQNDFLYVR